MLGRSESLFALSNGHIGLRGNLDEGEPHGCPAATSTRFYELRAAAVRRARLRLPGVRARRSSTSPTASSCGCSSTTSRSTCATATLHAPRARARLPRRPARPRRSTGRRRPASGCGSARARLVSLTQRAVVAIALRGGAGRTRRRGSSCSPSWSPTSSSPTSPDDPRGRRGPGPPAASRGARRLRAPAPTWCTAPGTSELRVGGRRWTTSSRRPTARGRRARPTPSRTGRGRRSPAVLQPGQRLRIVKFVAYGWSSRARCPPLRDQVAAALTAAPADRLGGAASTQQRAYLDDVLGRAPTSRSTATPSCSRRCASRCSTSCRPGRGRSAGAIPAKGLTGPGYDGHAFWDTEAFVLPVLTYTPPEAAARRAALAALDARPGAGAGRASSACAARPSRGGRSDGAGVLRLLAGRDRGLPRQRRHRRRRRPLPRGAPATTRSSARSALELLVRDRPAVALARPPRRMAAASASTASPARTSTARSPTTTSSPT